MRSYIGTTNSLLGGLAKSTTSFAWTIASSTTLTTTSVELYENTPWTALTDTNYFLMTASTGVWGTQTAATWSLCL